MRNTKHGLHKHKIYGVWQAMKQRCKNPNDRAYKYYGGRGIAVCESWRISFENFIKDMGFPDKGMTLDRINNDKGYSKENCKWATRAEQQNNRGVNKFIEFNNKRQTVAQWSKELKIPSQTIHERFRLGWEPEKILSSNLFYNKDGLALGGKANGAKNKAKTHCKWGHEFSSDNTHISKKGARACRKCKAKRQRATYKRKNEAQ